MGGLPNVLTAYQPVTSEDARKKMEGIWGVDNLPDKPGLTVTKMLPAAHAGDLKAMYIIGENPMVSDPDLNHAEECFKNLDLLVVQDIFLTETAQIADVVLPARCFAEKDGTFSNTERRVQRVRQAVQPPGETRYDWEIICDISQRMGSEMSYPDSEAIFNEIGSVTPSYGGLTYARIDNVGIHWPCPKTDHPGTPILHSEQFTRGKGLFHVIEQCEPAETADSEYPLSLTTGRLLYHYHTRSMTDKSKWLNELAPEGFVEMSVNDASAFQVADGEIVEVASRRGKITTVVKISEKATDGTVFIPFHYAQAAANRLTNAALDPVSSIPEYKVCAVKLKKVG
jgi:formate dehydrogenase major subunit/formate dehydrogenase alpha subunit